jgi:PAS domain S-box-containing protein
MPAEPLRVLVVDDVHDHAEMVAEFIRLIDAFADARIDRASTFAAALEAFERSAYDVAFFDYWLGDDNGLDLLRRVRSRGVDTPVVILTSRGAEEVAVEAIRAGAADYLTKAHLSAETLGRTIRHALALAVEERQRRDAEAARRATDERFRALVENISDVLLLVDADGTIAWSAPSSQRFVGWTAEDMAGQPMFAFVHPDDAAASRQRLNELVARPGERMRIEARVRHADGSWRVLEGSGVSRLAEPAVGAVVVSMRDVTDSRRIEEHFRQSVKMEAVGRLAGGVAHDFNNLLTAILGYANLMLEDMPPENEFRGDIEAIRTAGERAASLTRQLLAFSRRQMLQPQVVDVNVLVSQLEKMLRRLIAEDVELSIALGEGLPSVTIDPASFEQILVNLAVNARDAMPRGGRLAIETAAVELDAEYCGRHVSVVPGAYVMLAISDTGEGMDAATCARIFDPFFTTKEQGKGIGLGLATVYGMVKQSGGYIWVYSEPGEGTVFKVYFPVTARAADTAGVEEPPQRVDGTETVLLVEDEEAVRALAGEVLRRHGYVVIEASNGLEALQAAARHEGTIQLMVSDIVMPHLSGRDLAVRLAPVRPDMRVLLMSGYTEHAAVNRDLTPGAAFLQKPFTPDGLVRKVRSVLDTPVAQP